MSTPGAIADVLSLAIVMLIGAFSVWLSFWARIPIGRNEDDGRIE